MPNARPDVDHNTVCVLVAADGVRPTARKLNLPVSTVARIAGDNGVKCRTYVQPRSVPVRRTDEPLSQQPAHVIVTDLLQSKAAESKLNTAIWGVEATGHAATLKGEEALNAAQGMQATTRTLANAQLPGWVQSESSASLHLHLHRGLTPQDGTPEAPAIDV